MTLSQKSASQSTTIAIAKGKSMAIEGTKFVRSPLRPDVHVEEVGERYSSLATIRGAD